MYKNTILWKKHVINFKKYNANKISPKTPGEWIKFHRLHNGWSQMELALKLGLNEKQGRYLIKDYETRGLCPPKELSIKLAKLFNLNTKYFYDNYYEFIDSDYATLLKNWRNKNKLTQKQAASLICATYETWNSWENKRIIISRKCYEKLKKIL
ncbi:helix-turn-helix domain-containing protein [Clostridium sp. ZS2-4]|uniref:helix-turn-helix domain-containing protein n=1 Tax=Clostridium sp. ZS2-4 TaxID=2987703 RepID=UPI00227A080A|nr:helix-turn-helix transcriptional regulator [Clostridium sp. ZS2-4]MCY6355351.1 helix-turn-helix transcriptional regulator [Clostridium sp. ZS2-4]